MMTLSLVKCAVAIAYLASLVLGQEWNQTDAAAMAWRGYADFVATFLVGNNPLGPNYRIYVTPVTQMGIAGGTPVSEAKTNDEVFGVADGLLNSSDPFYRRSQTSHIEQLLLYMNRVKPTFVFPTAEEEAMLEQLRVRADTAQAAFRTAQTEAWNYWTDLRDSGQTTASFTQWVVAGYPSYFRAMQTASIAEERLALYEQQIYQGGGDGFTRRRNNIILAMNGVVGGTQGTPSFLPGINMRCDPRDMAIGEPGTPAPEPPESEVQLRAHYSLTGLEDQCNVWIAARSPQQTTWTFQLSRQGMNDWTSLGYSLETRSRGGSLFGLLGKSKSGSDEIEEFNSWKETFANTVELTLTLQGSPVTLDFRAGSWDVGDPRDTFPTLFEGRTDPLAGKVRVERVLLGYQPGFKMTIRDVDTFRSVREYIRTSRSNGSTGLRIWGFSFGGASGSIDIRKEDEIIIEENENNGGSFTIPPSTSRRPFLLGVLGRVL